MDGLIQQVLRLRQMCNHPLLIKSQAQAADIAKTIELSDLLAKYYGDAESSFAKNLENELQDVHDKECPVFFCVTKIKVCFEDCEKGILLPACLHVVCQDCVEDILTKKQEKGEEGEWYGSFKLTRSPVCRKSFTEMDLLKIIKNETPLQPTTSNIPVKPKINLRSVRYMKSTKLTALIQGIKDMFASADDTKCVVFSQWTSMLDLVEVYSMTMKSYLKGRTQRKRTRLCSTRWQSLTKTTRSCA